MLILRFFKSELEDYRIGADQVYCGFLTVKGRKEKPAKRAQRNTQCFRKEPKGFFLCAPFAVKKKLLKGERFLKTIIFLNQFVLNMAPEK